MYGASLVAQLVKNLPARQENLGSTPGLGRFLGEGKGYPLQYSSLENSMDCIVHGVTKSWTGLSDFHSITHSLFCIETEGKPHPLKPQLQQTRKCKIQVDIFGHLSFPH